MREKAGDSPEKTRIQRVARETLPALKPGESTYFDLPKTQPGRRVLLGCIQAVAFAKLGPGNYRMKSDAGGVSVTRLPMPVEAIVDDDPQIVAVREVSDGP